MHYYIDGYNLLFRLWKQKEDFSSTREEMISELRTKITALGLNVTLVFDSHSQAGESSRHHSGGLEIIFTSHGETADEAIVLAIQRTNFPKNHIVVTSDRKLAWFARRCLAKSESVEDFLKFLNQRYKNKIRQKTQPKNTLLKVPFPKVKSHDIPPKQNVKPEDCFDYYLKVFGAGDQETKKAETKTTSEFERWLSLFEKNLKNENGA